MSRTALAQQVLERRLEEDRVPRLQDVGRVVLIGQVTEQCVMYSALDAYIRHLQVAVPRDGLAHIHEHLADASLELMTRNMDADVCMADDCRF